MTWTRSITLALAQHNCAVCLGLGLRFAERDAPSVPCLCVMRAVFRICFRRFLDASASQSISRATLGRNEGPRHRGGWGLPKEEYVADFVLLARRTLDVKSERYRLFRMHFLAGVQWHVCCRLLKMERGEFFHEVYRIQAALGRACAELEPYPLFPVDEYFAGSRLVERVDQPHSTPARSRAAVRCLPTPTPARPALAIPPEALAA